VSGHGQTDRAKGAQITGPASLPLTALSAFLLLTFESFAGGRSLSQTPAPMANTNLAPAPPNEPLSQEDIYPCMVRAAKSALVRGLRNHPEYVYEMGTSDALEAFAEKACPVPPSIGMPYAMAAASKVLSDWRQANPEREAAQEQGERERELAHQREQARQEADRKAEVNALSTVYYKCLFERSAVLARASVEPAETLVKATIAACREPRMAVVEAYGRHGEPGGEEIVGDFDGIAEKELILNIIAERARGSASEPATPLPPKSRETPL
jgi:hypothetical protein